MAKMAWAEYQMSRWSGTIPEQCDGYSYVRKAGAIIEAHENYPPEECAYYRVRRDTENYNCGTFHGTWPSALHAANCLTTNGGE